MTFNELYDEFIERYAKLYRRGWKNDKYIIDKHCQGFFPRKLSSITKKELKEFLDNLAKTSFNTANACRERIRVIYSKALEWEIFDGENPAAKIKAYPKVKRKRFLQFEEIEDFFTVLADEPIDFQDFIKGKKTGFFVMTIGINGIPPPFF